MLEQLRENIACARKQVALEHLLAAVSGGEDSSVLLHCLHAYSSELGLQLSACHINHGLRPESEEEERFVKQLCAEYSIPFYCYQAPPKPASENLEAWAREQRYGFLEQARVGAGADFIATAHHQNDQAETLLFRFLTGRLANSAYGVSFLDKERRLFRPFLRVRKEEISRYRAEFNVTFMEDSSNFELNRSRNLLRHRYLSSLSEALQVDVVKTTTATAERLAEDETCLWSLAKDALLKVEDHKGELKVEQLAALPESLKWRVLKLLAKKNFGEEAELLSYQRFKELGRQLHLSSRGERVIELGFQMSCHLSQSSGHLQLEFCSSSTDTSD